jgi:drug/metabolite transporter (DMT)-like permease
LSVTQRRILVAVLALIGVLAIVVGVLYLQLPARKLPNVLGRIKHADYHRTKREVAAFVVGALFLLGALAVELAGRRSRPVEALPPEQPVS